MVRAVEDTTTSPGRLEQKRQVAQEKLEAVKASASARREEVKQLYCDKVTSRIEFKLNQYESNKDKYTSRYQGVKSRLTDLTEKLEKKECEVGEVQADLEAFDVLINDFAAAFRDFHLTLQGSRQYACGESEGQFANQIQASHAKLQLAKQKAQAVHTYFKNTLKPHIREMVNSCPAKPTKEPEND